MEKKWAIPLLVLALLTLAFSTCGIEEAITISVASEEGEQKQDQGQRAVVVAPPGSVGGEGGGQQNQNSGNQKPKVHVVQSGETLSSIARDHNTTVGALVAINGIEDRNLIYTGQEIRLSPPADNSPAPPPAPVATATPRPVGPTPIPIPDSTLSPNGYWDHLHRVLFNVQDPRCKETYGDLTVESWTDETYNAGEIAAIKEATGGDVWRVLVFCDLNIKTNPPGIVGMARKGRGEVLINICRAHRDGRTVRHELGHYGCYQQEDFEERARADKDYSENCADRMMNDFAYLPVTIIPCN